MPHLFSDFPPMKKIVMILFLLSGIVITANAQIDRHLKKEARAIIDKSHGAYYYSNSSHFGDFPLCNSILLSEQQPLSLKGNVTAIREVRYNYFYEREGYFIYYRYNHRTRNRLQLLATAQPTETATYTFDSLHNTVMKDVHILHAKILKRSTRKKKTPPTWEYWGVTPTSLPTRHYRLSLSESDVRYTFQNGLPIHYQTLSDRTYNGAHYWSYAECINYDTCNRPITIFKFSSLGFLEHFYTITYSTSENQIDSIKKYNCPSLYTIPVFPKNYQQNLQKWPYYCTDSAGHSSLHIEYDSTGRILSFTNTGNEYGSVESDGGTALKCEYNMQGDLIRRTHSLPKVPQVVRGTKMVRGNKSGTPDGPTDECNITTDECTITFEYQYEYDQHGNWTDCKRYCNGNLDMHIVREIEYGED